MNLNIKTVFKWIYIILFIIVLFNIIPLMLGNLAADDRLLVDWARNSFWRGYTVGLGLDAIIAFISGGVYICTNEICKHVEI